ncbi:MAG: transposase [Prevotellaceae bacterium]|nr:transposase [Prevotellaceae bacterium]
MLPASKSKRLTVFGLINTDCKLQVFINEGSLNSKQMIDYMEQFVRNTTKKTMVVLDNAPIHRGKLIKVRIQEWEKSDLYIFFLPPYSPELNKIEILWRFIKYKWLPFEAFLNFQNL